MYINVPQVKVPRVVIIGCGFGGLELAKGLAKAPVQVVLLDKNNYHTFQPLLYQVSTAGLEADSIAYPIRKIFKGQSNFHFRLGQVQQLVAEENKLITSIGELKYDYLVIATGSTTNYFGIKDFEQYAMPMKSVTEALNLRSLILQNFEKALLTTDLKEQEALMTYVVVGGGPTGVELAGALCELKKHVLPNDYPELDFRKMRVILVENGPELLQAMNETNRKRAAQYLEELGCELWLNTGVTKYDGTVVETKTGKQLHTSALIWAAGIKPVLINGLKPESINQRGRIIIDDYCKVTGYENVYAIGDVAVMAQKEYPNGHPQIAPVAIQQAQLLASNIKKTLKQWTLDKFSYFDKGNMATVGRNRAVVEVGKFTFGRFMGWLAWMGLHLMLLVGFRNKIVVFINWLWNYINYDRNIRLIIRPFKRESAEN
ncbi:MAG TPA: NAD(P)/FAD-dependent oxidoreductase [Chitinophagales bacterium]|nr:NAD(P)/FAD-dependent oxidoreductase [Chitinophagales bacterium]